MADIEQSTVTPRGTVSLYFISDGYSYYNSLGQAITEHPLAESDTLEQDRIIINGRCVGYRVFFLDNLNATDVLPTKEILALPEWQLRVLEGGEYTVHEALYNYKGEKIKETSLCTKAKESEIPWFEKVYDKCGKCYGYRVYDVAGRIRICRFNQYILEQEAYERHKKQIKHEKRMNELRAKMPVMVRDPENGKVYWVDKETGEIKE